MSANDTSITKTSAIVSEELELSLLETILEVAWNYRAWRMPTAESRAERSHVRQDEVNACYIAAEGLRYKASRDYLKARMILLQFEAELAEFEEHKGWV